jgi:hypothetical protein
VDRQRVNSVVPLRRRGEDEFRAAECAQPVPAIIVVAPCVQMAARCGARVPEPASPSTQCRRGWEPSHAARNILASLGATMRLVAVTPE